MKQKLKRYRENKLELEDKRLKVNSEKVRDSVKGSTKDYPYILRSCHLEGVAEDQYDDFERIYKIKSEIRDVEKFVNTIDNYKIRKAIEIYYMDPIDGDKPSWEKIADFFNDGSTGNSVKKSISRFLKKNS